MMGLIKDWITSSNRLERLWLLAKIEFKLRYYENRLGLFWAFAKPVIDMCIYYVVFRIILHNDIRSFASYLFLGLILWNFFVESTTGTIQILRVKKYLYEYSNMNKIEIYLSVLISNSIGFFFNFVMFVLFYGLMDPESFGFSFNVVWMPLLFVNLFILSMGLSLILSCLYIVARDVTQIWTAFTSILFFLSPIFYQMTSFTKALPAFNYLNPIAGIIINARKVMMNAEFIDVKLFLFDFVYAAVFLLFGIVLLNKLGSRAAEKI